jgi:phosphotransferase system enzyme I (PtsI)
MSYTLSGIAASPGIAIGKAWVMKQEEPIAVSTSIGQPADEIIRFEKALRHTKEDLEKLRDQTAAQLGELKAEIFDAHLSILKDPELIDSVKDMIKSEPANAEGALQAVSQMFVGMLENMDDELLRERAVDLKDITRRVLQHLAGVEAVSLSDIKEEVIILANDLTPSDTAQLNARYVKGFVTNIGSRTSHSSILARSMEIPAIVGTQRVTELVDKDNVIIIMDGFQGKLIIEPTESELSDYQKLKEQYDQEKIEWAKFVDLPTITKDGFALELAANIGRVEDVNTALQSGAEAIGLFRTEFVFMDRHEMPTEEEQFAIYRHVLERMSPKPVIIRTLDIGGDKQLPYLPIASEMNPFLGVRAIRLCLEQQTVFRTQLRALLRASVYGKLRIMFPMIAISSELRQAKQILAEEQAGLLKQGIAVSDNIEVGIMIEVPAAAMMADQLAKEVDFFSIGTNDLIQYTMAADRMNEQVAYLYQPYHPAILRLIHQVVKAADQQGIWVGVCGEMAGDRIAAAILLGLGVKELSMSAAAIPGTRALLSKLDKTQSSSLAETLLMLETSEEVEQLIMKELM